jgi:stringent starvation protein B
MSTVSTKPYLLRAIYEWCVDQGYTPYIAVVVDSRTHVPQQYVKDSQIVLNVGPEAVHDLVMGNETVTCAARFGGVAQSLSIPMDNVSAIYARENGHGMAFEIPDPVGQINSRVADTDLASAPEGERTEPEKPAGSRPYLTRVK